MRCSTGTRHTRVSVIADMVAHVERIRSANALLDLRLDAIESALVTERSTV